MWERANLIFLAHIDLLLSYNFSLFCLTYFMLNITKIMKMRDLISISSGHWTTENTCCSFKGRNWGQTNNTEILKGGIWFWVMRMWFLNHLICPTRADTTFLHGKNKHENTRWFFKSGAILKLYDSINMSPFLFFDFLGDLIHKFPFCFSPTP